MPPNEKPEDFRPYIPPEASIREFTVRSVVLGTLLGIIFGASSLYLVLKIGITVSASIPVAVISLALFRAWSKIGGKDATILENNIAQTAGSAGESIAFGVGVTMPAIMILGFDLEITRVMLVGLLGGLLGILMMIPLRRALIVAQHGKLKYPEGTACAEVLKAGADEESKRIGEAREAPAAATGPAIERLDASTIFTGFGIGLVYKTLMAAFRFWKDTPEKVFRTGLKGGSIAADISPELLGVGYVIGPRISSILMAGGVLNALLLIPMIKFFGDGMTTVLPPGNSLISSMGPDEIRKAYVLYIGAGAVTAGGIISLLRSMPLIIHGMKSGLSDFRAAAGSHLAALRTERDIPMKVVVGGIVGLVLAILLTPSLHMNLIGAIMIVLFGFLFVAVSSRLTGEIGSSSNPISGMTVATLLLTCLVFLLVGWTGGTYYVTALSVGGIVCVAASNGGSTSQDLKTGFLLGATPKYQQVAILIGAAASALVLGSVLLALNDSSTVYVPVQKVAPGLHVPQGLALSGPEKLRGPQAENDHNSYRVWHKTDSTNGPSGKYLVDESGAAVWLVDPGVNGAYDKRPDGSQVKKFPAPKVTLMSYIIKGMLDRQLPWGLVLFGIMIAIALELCEVSSLAFAVGVYLPIASSTPVFVGGCVRWLVDRWRRQKLSIHTLSEEELAAHGDRSPGVLMASGFIGGGAIAGIIIAIVTGFMPRTDTRITDWAEKNNPLFAGPHADLLATLPFAALAIYLYLVGREALSRRHHSEP